MFFIGTITASDTSAQGQRIDESDKRVVGVCHRQYAPWLGDTAWKNCRVCKTMIDSLIE